MLHLIACHVSDAAQMIVFIPTALAGSDVFTHRAVGDGIRIGDAVGARRLDEAPADGSVVGVEVAIQQSIVLAGAENDDHPFRRHTLKAFQLLGVEAQLQDEVRLCMPRELGVPGLIAPTAQRRWPLDADQEIADAVPFIVREHGLVDHIGAAAHGRARPFGIGGPVTVAATGFNRDDGLSVRTKAIEPGALVLGTLVGQQVRVRIPGSARGMRIPVPLELNQMLALEEVIQVAR